LCSRLVDISFYHRLFGRPRRNRTIFVVVLKLNTINGVKNVSVIKNYYKILKVKSSATKDDIKISYRKMALKYHPDKSQNRLSESKFKEITEAYHILIDENKRKNYDQRFLLNLTSTNSTRLVLIYIFVLVVVFSFVLWYLSHLSLVS